MTKIHRHIEPLDENFSLLHGVYYDVKNGIIELIGLSTHNVQDGVVGDQLISQNIPLNQIIRNACYVILFSDGVIGLDGNYLL